jgi:hypothetical protein
MSIVSGAKHVTETRPGPTDIDDDRIEKLPLWAGQLIYALDKKRESAERFTDIMRRERDEARQELLDHLTDTTGPADSDTFLERDEVYHDEQPTPPLGLGRGAVVSFLNPALNLGSEGPSIQAQATGDGRVKISTSFGDLSFTTSGGADPSVYITIV